MAELTQTVRRAGVGSFGVDASRVGRLFEQFPKTTFFHVRDAVGGIFGSHRREWLARTGVHMNPRGMRAENVSSRTGTPTTRAARRTFFYRVYPASKTLREGGSLEDIRGESFTTSDIALGLELGGTRQPVRRRLLAIPIGVTLDASGLPKSRWRTPAAYRRSRAGNDLVALRNRKGDLILYQVKGGKKAAATKGAVSLARNKGRVGGRRRILVPAYLLVRSVQNRPLLRYMATWDQLQGDRGRRLARAADRIVEDAKRGKRS